VLACWLAKLSHTHRPEFRQKMNVLNMLLPDGSAVRDFVEVGSMLATGVTIGLLCSSIGGVFMDTLGFVATLILFFGAGFYFLTRKA